MRPATGTPGQPAGDLDEQVNERDWTAIEQALSGTGNALLGGLLSAEECIELRRMYASDQRFRSRISMARYNYGQGEYKYFAYPLPPVVAQLRAALYAQLAPIANRWYEALRIETRFPDDHAQFLERCRHAGQARPTPLLLRYTTGDYNCLHQDIYGETVFPLQVAVLLSKPQTEFTGGEFILTEQRPRMQSRAEVVPLDQGDAVVFAVRERPAQGQRGVHRVKMRHGVSRLRSGERFTLGIIFHDAA